MKTYIVEETAVYYVLAKNPFDAEQKFLAGITVTDKSIQCDVPDREVYLDPEQRLTVTKEVAS